jgi:Protein of unknown function (DUF3224)
VTSEISATFEIKGWDEKPFDETSGGAKLTKASVAKEYSGDIEASSATEWLMAYQPDESAVFVGLERINGTIGGRSGTLVLRHVGAFEDGAAKATLTIVSGTDQLQGATGGGTLVADPAGRISLDVELAAVGDI